MGSANWDPNSIGGFLPGIGDWRDVYGALLARKTGANPALWHCPWSSDFVGVFDYSSSTGGGTNSDTAILGPGVRALAASSGATSQASANSPSVAPIITDVKLKRWGFVYRANFQTTPDANTQIVGGISQTPSSNAHVAVGIIGATSTTLLTSCFGGNATTFPAGTALSTKAPDAANYVWVYGYSDLTTMFGNVDGETADFIIALCSALPGSKGGYFAMNNSPAAGVHSDIVNIDKAAVFTEL